MATIKGGGRLGEKLKVIADHIGSAKSVRVGYFENRTYPDGTPVAMIAAIQNFGAPAAGIPPRPFFSNMVRSKSAEWGPRLAKLLAASNYDAQQALGELGEDIAGDLRQSVLETNSPPLKPATIRRKGFDKPLVGEHGQLLKPEYQVKT